MILLPRSSGWDYANLRDARALRSALPDIPIRIHHFEDHCQLLVDDEVVNAQAFMSVPFLTWYPFAKALELRSEAAFRQVEPHSDFTLNPGAAEYTTFMVPGIKPMSHWRKAHQGQSAYLSSGFTHYT